MTHPIDITCSHDLCGAQPGEECRWDPSLDASVINVPAKYHYERVEAAQFIASLDDRTADPGAKMPMTDDAIGRTGLV